MSISSDNAKILICSESRVQLKQYNQWNKPQER
jgi:hypothetical protein